MTDNLRLQGEIELTSELTDINEDDYTFALPESVELDAPGWCPDTVAGAENCGVQMHYSEEYNTGYYNWYAATAGTGTYDMAVDTVASSSICPSGWRLPKSGASGEDWNNDEFNLLSVAVTGSVTKRESYSPAWQYFIGKNTLSADMLGSVFVTGGKGKIGDAGVFGMLWTSMSRDNQYARRLRIYNAGGDGLYEEILADTIFKTRGAPIKCIANQ